MKKWETPSIDSLDMKFTEHGNSLSLKIDECWQDSQGRYWFSSSDGEEYTGPVNPPPADL